MPRTLRSLTVLLTLWALPLGAQELLEDELYQQQSDLPLPQVLDGYYEAIGGLEAWQEVKTLKVTGTVSMGPGLEAPFTVYVKRPDKVRLEFTVQGMTGIQAFDGENGWMFMPFMGKTAPEPMPEELTRQLRQQADLEGPLVDFEQKGHKVELLGKGLALGRPAYMLKVTLANGDEQTFYLDEEDFLPVMMEGTGDFQGVPTPTQTTFTGYREVEDLMIAHSVQTGAKGSPQRQTITVESVLIDPSISDDTFSMPETPPPAETEQGSSAGS